MWCVCSKEYHSAIKRRKSCICDYMNGLEGIMLSEIKSNRKRQILYDFIYMQKVHKVAKSDRKQSGGFQGLEERRMNSCYLTSIVL